MRKSKVLAKLRAGHAARIFETDDFLPAVPKLAAAFGYDGVWVDGEHRTFDPRETQMMIGFHHLADIDCIYRPPARDRTTLTRLLDAGATAVMVPLVNTAEEARQLVQATKFPPLGDRGYNGDSLDADFGLVSRKEYLAHAASETCLVVQIETPEAVANADAIAAVPGVDVLFLGPADLSLRLPTSGSYHDPLFVEAQAQVAAAAMRHRKAWGRPSRDPDDIQSLLAAGARFVQYGTSSQAILRHLRDCQSQLEAILKE